MKIKDEFITILLKNIDFKNKEILEIGCGNGFRTKQLSKIKSTLITAIDPDEKSIAFAKKNYSNKNITYLISKAEKLPFENKQFDLVVFTLSLHHTQQPRKALQEACRVLKDTGLVVIIEPGMEGTIFETEIKFGCFDGDETKAKAKIYKLIMHDPNIKNVEEFWGKTIWQFDSFTDFKKNMLPKKNTSEAKEFLIKNNYKLWGERRINVFKKIN